MPHPWVSCGSMVAPMNWFEPNCRLLIWPQVSMLPVVVGLCASGFARSQSGMKLLLASVHVRFTDGLANPAAAPPGIRSDGLACESRLPTLAPCRYLPTLTFSAVFPLPSTSYAAPIRGVMSL